MTLVTLAKTAIKFHLLEGKILRFSFVVAAKSVGGFEAIINNFSRALVLQKTIRSSQVDSVVSFMDDINIWDF